MDDRRKFIKSAATFSLLPAVSQVPLFNSEASKPKNANQVLARPKVIFFDVNETLLDLEPLKESVVRKLGGQQDLGTLWFTTMLQYSLVTTLAGEYMDFGKIGAAALIMVGKNNGIIIAEEEAGATIKPILSLKPHREVEEALKLLKKKGYKLVSFTNSSNHAVTQQLRNAALDHYFDEKISVEDYGKFKPARDVYRWAARKLQVDNKDCLLVAAHGWDVAGALWADWQAAFIARPGQQLFPLAPQPQINESNLMLIAEKLR